MRICLILFLMNAYANATQAMSRVGFQCFIVLQAKREEVSLQPADGSGWSFTFGRHKQHLGQRDVSIEQDLVTQHWNYSIGTGSRKYRIELVGRPGSRQGRVLEAGVRDSLLLTCH